MGVGLVLGWVIGVASGVLWARWRAAAVRRSMAHDIKNGLTPIRGYARLLTRALPSVDPAERAFFAKGLRIVEAEAARIETRVRRVLEPGRADPQAIDLEPLLVELAAVAEALPGVAEVIVRHPSACPPVRGVASELFDALLNLVQNAAEAMESTPDRLELRVDTQDGLRVLVLDRGVGLPPGGPGRSTKPGGSGLGVARVREVMARSGGTATWRGRGDGPGTEVELRWP